MNSGVIFLSILKALKVRTETGLGVEYTATTPVAEQVLKKNLSKLQNKQGREPRSADSLLLQ
jgi:hypothetical protein